MSSIAEVVVSGRGNPYYQNNSLQEYNTPNLPYNEFQEITRSLFREVERAGHDDSTLTSDIAHLMPEVLNRGIITLAEDLRVGIGLVDVININSDTESFLKEYGMRAAWVPEGAEIPVGRTRYDKEVITVQKFGIRPNLSYESIADSKIGILQRQIRQAILAMVKFQDAHIMDVLNLNVPNGTTIKGIVEEDHSFNSGQTTAIDWTDVVKAYTSIERENLNPTHLIIHPYQYAQMLTLQEFRDLTNNRFVLYPSKAERAQATGVLNEILGMEMVITNSQTVGEMLFIDKNNYAIYADRQPLLTESDRDIVRQFQTVAFSQRGLAGVLNESGAAKVTGLATTLAGITA